MTLCSGMSMSASQSPHGTVAGSAIDRDEDMMLIAGTQHATMECGSTAASAHSTESSTGTCTASAACGVVTASALQALVFFASAASAAALPAPAAPGVGFFTDAPDRPPRAFA